MLFFFFNNMHDYDLNVATEKTKIILFTKCRTLKVSRHRLVQKLLIPCSVKAVKYVRVISSFGKAVNVIAP